MTNGILVSRLLSGALLGVMASSATAQVPATPGSPDTPLTILTNAAQIAALGTNFPGDRYTARLQGVVIYVSLPARRLYVQDGERGVQVNLLGPVTSFRAGQRVEVRGTVLGGLPAIRLMNCEAETLGDVPLPVALEISPHRLAVGAEPYRFVSVRGVVRDMVSDKNRLTMRVAHEGLVFDTIIPGGKRPLPRDWLDAEVEMRGLTWPVYNATGRASGFALHLADTNHLKLLVPGIPNRFSRPLLTCAEAGQLRQDWGPRVKISGTVTVHRPGEACFVDDGTGVMCVKLLPHLEVPAGAEDLGHEPQTWLQPGERVEIIGVRHNWYSLTPTLVQAEYRRLGQGAPVKPLEVSVNDLLEGRHSGKLATLEARLLDQRQWRDLRLNHQSLVLRAGDDIFQARWESESPAKWDLKLDGYVRITGVNDAEGSASRKRSTFQILLRSPADVVPAKEPPFWARPEARRILLAAGGVGFVAGAWILLQRVQMRRLERRVAERTSDLSGTNARLQEEVIARERAEGEVRVALEAEKELNQLKSSFVSMVSHEFRTPLEVILSSSHILDRYLDRLPPEKRHEQLRAIRKSVHRMSDLMEDVLTLGKFEAARMTCSPAPLDLASFCRRCADEIDSASESLCPIRLSISGMNEDAAADEGLLSHILTNLLSNAVKYSPPGSPVEFCVTRQGTDAQFVVRDSGCGIPEADRPRLFTAFHRARNVGQITGNGLGLVIVKRCVELHGGAIRYESEEGKGTSFTVTLPLFDGTRIFRRAPQSAATPP